ncbi:MAG TPA: zinc metalloprotease, partial [Chitinophagaceae bacterium]
MKKLYLSFLVIGLFASALLQAQQNKCGFAYTMEQARARGFRDDAFEAEIARLIQQKLQQQGQGRLFFTGPVTLPVIFHVIHRGETEGGIGSQNLSQAIIQAQLNQLNADFANLSGSLYAGIATDVQIQFCLAQQDPGGVALAQPGIHRINGITQGWSDVNTGAAFDSPGEIIAYFDGTIKPASIWDPTRYINIWTADMNASGLLGYASFPALSGLPGLPNSETDLSAGVVMAAGSAGSVSTLGYAAPYNMGRTLTHELGHFFGLRHIWGDGDCTATDYCADTPPQDQETAGCPAPGTLNNCIPNVPKMFENYMDYSNDACLNTFTADQAIRMQTVMDFSPRRLSLITSTACTPPVPNAISFLTTTTATTEAPTVLTCPRYKEVTVSLRAAVAASGNATVTFNLAGTALNVAD